MNREREIVKTTYIGGAANVALLIFKFVAGILSGSAAMIADAVHSLSDFITDIIVIVFVHISSKPEDKDHDYGHGKYETLATTIIGLVLLGVAVLIIYKGAISFALWMKGENIPSPGIIALWAALASIIVKELVFRYTVRQAEILDSQSLRANAWHHRSDAFSSIGTAVGIGGAIFLGEKWTILDPLASIVVGCFIVKVSIELIGTGMSELLESSLPENTEREIIKIVESFEDVSEPHNLRTRRIGNKVAIDIHIRMDGDISLQQAHDRTTEIEHSIKEHFGQCAYVTIHTEPKKTE